MATDYKIRLKRFNGTDYDTLNLVSSNVVMDNGDTLQNKLENYVRPNLLDNWYFVGGGSQQGGGQFPINQRGQTSYTGSAAYSLDRWVLQYDTNLQVLSAGTKISGKWDIKQKLKSLPSGIYTVSVLLSDYQSAPNIKIEIFDSNGTSITQSYTNNNGLITKTMSSANVPATISLNLSDSSGNSEATIIAIKLELGNTQTLAHQENGTWVINEIPDYEEQLIKCSTSIADSSDTYANKVVAYTPKTVSYTIDYSLWTTATDYYYQTITISNAIITSKTKVDIQADSTAINQLIADGVTALYINNSSGTLTLYAIGNPTTVNITVQLTYYETE